jgi:hypothetical protein
MSALSRSCLGVIYLPAAILLAFFLIPIAWLLRR